jgi:hypothetical protein
VCACPLKMSVELNPLFPCNAPDWKVVEVSSGGAHSAALLVPDDGTADPKDVTLTVGTGEVKE